MGKIEVLDAGLANQIAAGEVVERPASVVKELVENALDAQADRIQVEIEEGGIQGIRVSDNGLGMDRSDALAAFERHATSKIKRERDLFSIRSLGFRGEALPSIASVSRLTLETWDGGDQAGIRVTLDGGTHRLTEDISRSRGTDVRVEDLFFNTPARLKYLKTVNTEVSHVADVIGRLALAHPEVSFLLKHKQRELFYTPGNGNVLHVVHALYGKQVARKMIPFSEEDMDFSVTGLVGRPEVTRSNRSYLSTIINGRFIRNIPVAQSLLRAYDTLLPIGRYPIVVLSITMDPKLADVNVHPSKLEVRLSKEKELCRLVETGVKKLFQREVLIPEASSPKPLRPTTNRPIQERLDWSQGGEKPEKVREAGVSFSEVKPAVTGPEQALLSPDEADDAESIQSETTEKTSPARKSSFKDIEEEQRPLPHETPPAKASQEGKEEKVQSLPDLTPLAQIHGTYIVAQSEDGFYILDQHAAHERIYYEQFSEGMKKQNRDQQPLLIPLSIECTPSEAAVLQSRISQLGELGIEMEPFGGSSFLVRSHPGWFPQGSEEDLIREVFDWMKSGEVVDLYRLRDDGAKMMACKAAIKANRHLKKEEMENLLVQLKACRTPFTCPHGRPVLIHFSTYEVEKMFKRVM